jgi:hypothetical protein
MNVLIKTTHAQSGNTNIAIAQSGNSSVSVDTGANVAQFNIRIGIVVIIKETFKNKFLFCICK